MAVSRMAVALRIDDSERHISRGSESKSPRTAKKLERERSRILIDQLSRSAMLMNDFFLSFCREIQKSGIDCQNTNEVLTFTENKRLQLLNILEDVDENDKIARFNLCNLIGFLRRIQERNEDLLRVVSKPSFD
uniref:Uncharacterized protein n=1 Tax=Caenorhabditis japonica TaxID=281687 RepID=A0A8R1DTP2_CAEJA